MKKKLLAALILTLVLAGCGSDSNNALTTDAGASESAENTGNAGADQGTGGADNAVATGNAGASSDTVKVDMPDTQGTGHTYQAQDMNNLWVNDNPLEYTDIEDADNGTITIYDNHTVSYTDASGRTMKGFFLTGLNQYGYALADTLLMIDPDTGATVYLDNLQYLDEYGLDTDFSNAATIRFQESMSSGIDLGDLALVGSYASDPDAVYLLTMWSDYMDGSYLGGTCYCYRVSTGEYTELNWSGAATDLTASLAVWITDSQGNTLVSGAFDAVYACADGTAEVEQETAEELSAVYYYAFDTDAGTYQPWRLDFDIREEATDYFTVYSNNITLWEDKNGNAWRGFLFQGYNDNGYDFLRFTNGKEIMMDEVMEMENDMKTNTKTYCMLYRVMQEGSDFGAPFFVGTANEVAPGLVFLLYEGADAGYGSVTVYDPATGLFYEGSWQLPYGSTQTLDSDNPQNIEIYLNYKDMAYTISRFDDLEKISTY